MGGAIAGVLGGVQLVSGIASSNSQAKAQARATQAQIQSSVDAAKVRQMEIMQQKDAANFQLQMGTLSRQQQYAQANYEIQYQQLKEEQDANEAKYSSNVQQLQQLINVEQTKAQANSAKTQADINYEQVLQGLASAITQYEQQQVAPATEQATKQLNESSQRSAVRSALLAANGVSDIGAGSSSNNVQRSADVISTLADYAKQLQNTEVGRQLNQLVVNASIESAAKGKDLAKSNADYGLREADRQTSVSNNQYAGFLNNLALQQNLNESARVSALRTLDATNSMNQQTENVNTTLANAGYGLQYSANNNLLSNQIGTAKAQYNPPNQFLSLLNSGANAYNVYTQAKAQDSLLSGGKK